MTHKNNETTYQKDMNTTSTYALDSTEIWAILRALDGSRIDSKYCTLINTNRH